MTADSGGEVRTGGEPAPIPAGKIEAPVPVLIGRWLLLGCAATLAVVIVAFLGFGVVVARGLSR